MAFDQNSFPKELRPLNVARTVADEPRIALATTTGRNPDGLFPNLALEVNSPNSIPVFYPSTVAEAGLVGVGYGNAMSGVPTWRPRIPVPVGHPGMNTAVAVGIGYSPNLGGRLGGNAVDLVSSSTTTSASGPSVCNFNMSNRVVGNGLDHGVNDMAVRFGYNPNLGNKVSGNVANQTGNDLTSGYGNNANFGNRVGGNGTDQASDDGGDDSVSGKKVKLLCSFGGKILPRPSDGMLRYVGGQTRIISVRRDVSFSELVQKMLDTYGQPVVIKYQLPDEDLDALVSVSCADDLDNMKDEYGKLVERSPDGSAKLRVFLFSASEVDPSSVVQFGDLHNSEQRYVDAVNGIMDGVGGGIMRKESMTSATSTQNSDFSGTDIVDSSIPGQGDTTGPPSAGKLSPKGDSATSHDNSTRLVIVDPNPAVYSEVSTVPLGIPVVKSAPPQTSPSQPECELERSVPVTVSQQQVGLQQPGIGIPSTAPYLQTYVGPRQEVMNRADHLQLPPQMGFPNAHLLGTASPVYTQQQFCDSVAGITQHHFIPAVHMTMTPSSSHVNIRPNVLQPLMQPQQTRLDHYVDESTFVPRVVQFPTEQSYNSYQVQVPSPVVGGAYGWHQVPPPEHVIFHDGLVSHQQVMYPEKSQRLEDCYMCQRALPHTHSDTLVQVHRDSGGSPVSDSNSTYHSPRLEDNLRAQPMNMVMVSGALAEGNFGQGVEARLRVQGQVDPLVGTSHSEVTGISQISEGTRENETMNLQQVDLPMISAPHGVIRRGGDVQSPNSAFMVAIPQRCQDDAVQQHSAPFQYQVKQENLVNDPFNQDVPLVGGAPVQTSEYLVHESPTAYPNKFPGVIPKEDNVDTCIAYDHLRQIDGRMETLRISPTEVYVNNEHGKSPIDTPRVEDSFDHKAPQVGGREVTLDNTVGRSHFKPTEVVASSPAEVSHGYNSQPVEFFEAAQPSMWGNPESYPQSRVGFHPQDAYEFNYGNPVVSTHITNGIQPPAEWKDENLRLQPKMVPNDVDGVTSNDAVPQDSSNSLFSNQDPWSLSHDTHLPPKPTKIQLRKEPFTELRMDDGGQQSLGNLNRDLSSEPAQSSKGSAEEQIKQELQAVAEGVAACVFQSSSPSNPDLHDKDEYAYQSNQDEDVQNNTAGMQNRAKVEDVKTKFRDKANLGFPVSDSRGRLQIIKNSDLEERRELGSGTFGTVYHGKWRGTDVAIKRINDRCFAGKPSEQERMREDFWNEAIKLADLHHPNVVAFYGVVLDGPGGSVATVTEYMVNGSLRNALQKNEKSLDKRKRLLIAMDVAFGMEYLHEKNIVHFDLKSDNLLVNLRDPHRPICKVGDLGLSKVKCHTLISGGVRGTLPWMAPELLNGGSSLVSEKVDVFSFGIVLWELLTGDEPYADLHYGAIIGGIVSNTLRPPVPDSCDPEWKSLMERCWSSEPTERLNFTEIANELRAMTAKIPPKGQSQPQQPPSTQPQIQK
ncbi:PREDICTED: serine/threonine-kinase [Prunus dulcis]|uniref:PREDICTED: serine/threonine-kinase n=1 Tax=Prunus dulcis TaxID=3755 RepID=A0A5E4FCE8_PRUDU|nr:uncharacterized protein LOC117636169 isoform X1 [Prunus dulcis]XP_034226551.1 uncharacterized protein LOC117636169 isoform X1 [Prunus dulcis]VVA25080.1 PREDICTED: serine/threonine-kinase [Prunus dulcis]